MATDRRTRSHRRRGRKTRGMKGNNDGSASTEIVDPPHVREVGHDRKKGARTDALPGPVREPPTPGRWLGALVTWVGKLGWLVTAIGLLGGCLAFMIEMEDRQAERIFRAWEIVAKTVPTEQIAVARGGPTVGNSNTNAGRALEFLNREFSGLGCGGIVTDIAGLMTGDERRECVLPRKRRESLAGLQLSNMYLEKVWLPKALLKLTQLEGSFLEKANLEEADLTCANLASTLLASSEMEKATLKRARMRSANLAEARLNNSDLRGTDLVVAHLKATDLEGARMGCLETGSGNKVCTDIRGATSLTCEQLRKARNWESAYRDEGMQCGGTMPIPNATEAARATARDAGNRQTDEWSIRNVKWDHDMCPYERVNPRAKVTVQR